MAPGSPSPHDGHLVPARARRCRSRQLADALSVPPDEPLGVAWFPLADVFHFVYHSSIPACSANRPRVRPRPACRCRRRSLRLCREFTATVGRSESRSTGCRCRTLGAEDEKTGRREDDTSSDGNSIRRGGAFGTWLVTWISGVSESDSLLGTAEANCHKVIVTFEK